MRSGSRSARSGCAATASSNSVNAGPPYHGVRFERVATLSPSRADTGTIAAAVTPTASSATPAAYPACATSSAALSITASILLTTTITCATSSSPSR